VDRYACCLGALKCPYASAVGIARCNHRPVVQKGAYGSHDEPTGKRKTSAPLLSAYLLSHLRPWKVTKLFDWLTS